MELILVIVGPTASGKTSRAIALAKERSGEVISADSRQVYRGLDIGTEKATVREMRGIPHHCIDIASPRRACSVEQWRRCAEHAIAGIRKRGRLPIVAGGSWFYVHALLSGLPLPSVRPNASLRRGLARHTADELWSMLARLDPHRAGSIDRENPRRLIRAIEIATALGHVPPHTEHPRPGYAVEWVFLNPPQDVLIERITVRLDRALRRGLVSEVRGLRAAGISWKRIDEFGLEYRAVAAHLRGELSRADLRTRMLCDLTRYAKKQSREFAALIRNYPAE